MVRSRSERGREACWERESREKEGERLGWCRNLLRLPSAPAMLLELSSSGSGWGLPVWCPEQRGEVGEGKWRAEERGEGCRGF
jgi:hypothetical protein